MTDPPTPPLRWAAVLCALALGCGPTIRRTLPTDDQRHITYEDLCHLQDWYDQRTAGHAAPFRVVNEQSTETAQRAPDERGHLRRVALGEGTYLVASREDRLRFDRLLRDEYDDLPALAVARPEGVVRVHVAFWQTGSIRRIRPDVEVTVEVDGHTHELPSHPCVGEFLFGEQAYAMRHNVLSAERARARGEIPAAYAGDAAVVDVGATDAAVVDAGATDAAVVDAPGPDAGP
ncbi:MAG: hypothetical protein JWM10_1022 [Myxococcaceae bacterium]|nr:hypothetical protein [Myxococcaceae bacterium]